MNEVHILCIHKHVSRTFSQTTMVNKAACRILPCWHLKAFDIHRTLEMSGGHTNKCSGGALKSSKVISCSAEKNSFSNKFPNTVQHFQTGLSAKNTGIDTWALSLIFLQELELEITFGILYSTFVRT